VSLLCQLVVFKPLGLLDSLFGSIRHGVAPVVPPGSERVSVGSNQYASAAGEGWMVLWIRM
jgi:hypothetical protein